MLTQSVRNFDFSKPHREFFTLGVGNPITNDFDQFKNGKPITEAHVSDFTVGDVRAVYPYVWATHADRLTRNYTYYSLATILGREDKANPAETTGFRSYVQPFGKPFLTEHRSQDDYAPADVPMGRTIFAGVEKYGKNHPQTPLKKKGYANAGTAEGTGHLVLVPAITEDDAIARVLGGQYHTVSIGSYVDGVIEAISGKDIAALAKAGNYDDMPEYRRGQVYKVNGTEQLSFWKMIGMRGNECSFVNTPADELAMVKTKDIGEEGIRLLMGEKKPGTSEFAFFDPMTNEKVDFGFTESCWDESFDLTDSVEVGRDIWWARYQEDTKPGAGGVSARESVDPSAVLIEKIREVKSKMNIKKQIQECLKAPETFAAVKEKLEGDALELFTTEVAGVVEANIEALELGEAAKAIAEGKVEGKIEDEAKFRTCQEVATAVLGEWNETAAGLALLSYVESGGKYETAAQIEAEETAKAQPATYGELYKLEESHPLYGKESTILRKDVEAKEAALFAGKGYTYLITNLESAALAIRLIDKVEPGEKTLIASKATEYGVWPKTDESEASIVPVYVEANEEGWTVKKPLYTITSEADLTPGEGVLEALGDEVAEGVRKFLESAETAAKILFAEKLEDVPLVDYSANSEKPVALGAKFLFESFEGRQDSREHTLLAQLTAVCRAKGVTKDEATKLGESFNIFIAPVLEKLLESVKPVEAKATEGDKPDADEIPALESRTNPSGEKKPADESVIPGATPAPGNNVTLAVEASKPLRSKKTAGTNKEKR